MAVRVNKSAFNIREKINELTKRFGLKGSELAAAKTTQEARDLVSAGRKNIVINGDMRISQRLGSSGENDLSGTSNGYGVDRFQTWQAGGGEIKLQQSINAPPGFTNSLLNTVNTADTSVAAADYYMIQTRIEGFDTHHLGWGTSNAKDVTISFWVRSSVSGTYSFSLWRDNQTYNYVTDYTINNTNTWEYKTITIPGPTSGTWATNNGIGIGLWWDLGSGTTYSTATTETWGQNNKFRVPSQTSWIGTGSAVFRLTGVQLEVGKNATEFEHRSYGEELALCERYAKSYAATTNSVSGMLAHQVINASSNPPTVESSWQCFLGIHHNMRITNPTVDFFGDTTAITVRTRSGASTNVNSISCTDITKGVFTITPANSVDPSNYTQVRGDAASGGILLDAEL